jgi:DNA adenine methylase
MEGSRSGNGAMPRLDRADQRPPLLKWAGGKRWLAPRLIEIISGATFSRYFEPFCGGAALFFQLAPRRAVLSDLNPELINCYKQIKQHPNAVIAALRTFKNSEDGYYLVRKMKPRLDSRRAARILYLTTLAFNGIYRVNLRGKFNVPYGYKTHLGICDEDRIHTASTLLHHAKLLVADFEDVAAEATSNDVIYFDPPYTVAHGNNGFLKYNESILQWEDQLRLACVAVSAAERGCKVIVSNADHPSVRKLYSDFTMERVWRASVMAASTSHRRCVTECVFHNFS